MRSFCLLNGTDFARMAPFPVEIGNFSCLNERDNLCSNTSAGPQVQQQQPQQQPAVA